MTSKSYDRVLVTGGRGFVGSHVVRALVGSDADVTVFGPTMAVDLLADLGGRIRFVDGSISDAVALDRVMREQKPKAVVSCAAYGEGDIGLMRSGESDPDKAFDVNVTGFRRVLECAVRHGVPRVVWTSSTVVYGPARLYVGRADESSLRSPATVYGLTKCLAEDIAAFHARRGLEITGLRLPLVLGAGLWYRGAAAALVQMLGDARRSGASDIAFHDEPLDLMHVADVARAIQVTLAASRLPLAVYNINGFTARVSEMIDAIKRIRPAFDVNVSVQPPAQTFPLISDAAFRADLCFAPEFDLDGLCRDLISRE